MSDQADVFGEMDERARCVFRAVKEGVDLAVGLRHPAVLKIVKR